MEDEKYFPLTLTGKDIQDRLDEVVTLDSKVEAIGQYNGEIEQGKGYIGSLQRDIKNVDNKISDLNKSYATREEISTIQKTVDTQRTDINQNASDIAILTAKTIGDNQPFNAGSLQAQIINKVSQSEFKDLKGQVSKIENKNSEQDTTLAAIGRIEDTENEQEGSGDLLKLQEIIKKHQEYISKIETLEGQLEALAKKVNTYYDKFQKDITNLNSRVSKLEENK